MKRFIYCGLLLSDVSCFGCGARSVNTPVPDSNKIVALTNTNAVVLPSRVYEEVTYSLPQHPISHFQINSDNLYLDRAPGILHNHKGHLYMEGKSYGKVAQGDQVQVTPDKQVFINGTKCLPK